MRGVNHQAAICLALFAVIVYSPAWAQVTPGQVQDTLKFPAPVTAPAPMVPVEKTKQAAPTAAAGARSIQVSSFTFTGNTVFTQAQLAPLVADYLNKPVTLLDVYAAADKVADFYADHGYTLASVNVPPQKLSGGVVRLEVNEGVIGRVVVEGTNSERGEHIVQYLGNAHSGSIYHGPALEQGLQRINELPGLSARAVVQPGEDYGSTDLLIKAHETPVSGSMFIDNYGTRQIGQTRVAANVLVNNPFNVEDQLNFLGLRSNDGLLTYLYAGYSLPVNFDGTRLELSYGHARFDVPGTIPVAGTNDNGRAMLVQPVIRTRTDRLDAGFGVSRVNTDAQTSPAGLPPILSGTSITLLELTGSYNHVFPNTAITQVTANISSNFGRADSAAEARPLLGKAEGADQRFRVELDAQHVQPLVERLFLQMHLNGAYSPDALTNATQYSIGGPQSVRGFPTSELRGDRGFFGQVSLGRSFDAGAVRLTPRVFVDGGKVFCAAPAADCQVASLTSAGVGADAAYDRISAKLDYSHPLDSRIASDGREKGRVYGSLFVNF